MPHLDPWTRFFTLLYIGCAGILLIRLFAFRFYRRYRWFSFFLILDVAQTAVLFSLTSRNMYARVYFLTEPVIWLLYYMVLFELFGLMLKDYPGITLFGKRLMGYLALIALAISLMTLVPGLKGHTSPYPILQIFTGVQRTVMVSVLLFLFLIHSFLFRYPIPHSRNAIAYTLGYSVLFACKALGLLVITAIGVHLIRAVNVAILAISCGCMLLWIVTLTRAGEVRLATLGNRFKWKPDEGQRLRAQLNAINALVFRLIHK